MRSIRVEPIRVVKITADATSCVLERLALIERNRRPTLIIFALRVNSMVVTLISGTPCILYLPILKRALHVAQSVRVNKAEWIIQDIGVAIPSLWAFRFAALRHRVNAGEPPLSRGIIPRLCIVQPRLVIPFELRPFFSIAVELRIALICGSSPDARCDLLPEWEVVVARHPRQAPRLVHHHPRRAELVGDQSPDSYATLGIVIDDERAVRRMSVRAAGRKGEMVIDAGRSIMRIMKETRRA